MRYLGFEQVWGRNFILCPLNEANWTPLKIAMENPPHAFFHLLIGNCSLLPDDVSWMQPKQQETVGL